MATQTQDRDEKIDRLLDRLRAPLPSPALRARVYQAQRGPAARALTPTPFRSWAMGAAAAAAVVVAAYVTTGDRPGVPTFVPGASTLALQYGTVHPTDAVADADDDSDDSDDDDEAYALQSIDGPDMAEISLI